MVHCDYLVPGPEVDSAPAGGADRGFMDLRGGQEVESNASERIMRRGAGAEV